MDLHRLEIFCEVWRQRSFSAAARKLGLTQSAVSQQVRALEKELGTGLFDAADRGMPTPAGDFLFEEGARLLAQARDIANGVRHAGGVAAGTVSFGMIDSAAIEILPGPLKAFKARHPQVKVEAVVKTSGELIELVSRHELDFAVAVTNRIPDTMAAKDIHDDSIVAVVPAHSPLKRRKLSVRDLRGEPLILYPPSAHSRAVIDEVFRSRGVVPTVSMEMHYPEAILALVRQGAGVGLVSELSTRAIRMHGLAIVHIEEFKGARRIGVVTHKGRRLSPQAQALIETIIKKS